MSMNLLNASRYFFYFSVALYYGYVYFGVEKMLVSLKEIW